MNLKIYFRSQSLYILKIKFKCPNINSRNNNKGNQGCTIPPPPSAYLIHNLAVEMQYPQHVATKGAETLLTEIYNLLRTQDSKFKPFSWLIWDDEAVDASLAEVNENKLYHYNYTKTFLIINNLNVSPFSYCNCWRSYILLCL